MENMVKKIGVIFYVDNEIENVKKCIDVLNKQKRVDITVYTMVTENASSLKVEYLDEFITRFEKINVIYGKWIYECEAYHDGIVQVIKDKQDAVWLLNDKMSINEETLETILEYADNLNGIFGFLSSSVLCKNELYYKMVPDIREQNVWNNFKALDLSIFPVSYASFGGLFVPISVIKKIGLPMCNMRMGYDGYEFSNRISEQCSSYYIVDSIIEMNVNDNIGYDLYFESQELISNYRYVYRNDYYLSRKEGVKYIGFYFFRLFCQVGKIISQAKNKKLQRIMEIIIGTVLGIFFKPKLESFERIDNE